MRRAWWTVYQPISTQRQRRLGTPYTAAVRWPRGRWFRVCYGYARGECTPGESLSPTTSIVCPRCHRPVCFPPSSWCPSHSRPPPAVTRHVDPFFILMLLRDAVACDVRLGQLHYERDLGVPIDVIDPRNYLLPKKPVPVPPEDEALLNWREGDEHGSGVRCCGEAPNLRSFCSNRRKSFAPSSLLTHALSLAHDNNRCLCYIHPHRFTV